MDKVMFDGEVSSAIRDGLEEMIRGRIQGVLSDILEEELEAFLTRMSGCRRADGKAAVVRNGYHKERIIQTGLGPFAARIPRTRNHAGGENFQSVIIPAYKRTSVTFDEAVCYFYLKGISTGGMADVLKKLFGAAAGDISPATITRLTRGWQDEFAAWNKRDLSAKEYCYIWVDGIHFNVRIGEEKLCTLVVMGATRKGTKELLAVEGGYRESSESWSVLLRGLRSRGLRPPKLFIADGALGFWKAARDVCPEARTQLCWVHKTANVLDKLPKKLQPKAKGMIHDMHNAETKADAIAAYTEFLNVFEAKYPRATKSLEDNFDELFAFYDFPAEHWRHIRTTNPIESTFATVRLRTKSTRGHGSLDTTLAMVYKLAMEASKGWRALNGSNLILKIYDPMIIFVDGIEKMAA
jgi:transposase-like protein